MPTWIMMIIVVAVASLLSMGGGLYLLYGKHGVHVLQRLAVPFAAGALLAAAFVDLLPEAFEQGNARTTLIVVMVGFLFFFVLERGLSWFHHHHEDDEQVSGRRNSVLVVIGDVVHNFIDGLAIGAAFLANPAAGIVTTLAVSAHEIPKEMGDFGLMLAKGMSKPRVLLANAGGALATVIAATMVYFAGESLPVSQSFMLAGTAGFFIYIAASDIIPTIHGERSRRAANIQTLVLLFGVAFVTGSILLVHSLFPGA